MLTIKYITKTHNIQDTTPTMHMTEFTILMQFSSPPCICYNPFSKSKAMVRGNFNIYKKWKAVAWSK